jgi:hypothetical protein
VHAEVAHYAQRRNSASDYIEFPAWRRSIGSALPFFRRAPAARSLLPVLSVLLDVGDSRYSMCRHSFRATGITTYLQNGGTLKHAQAIANHESARTTKLYDLTGEELSFEEVDRIRI